MHIVVLGAGVVGVATAYYLAQDGHEVTVLEREAAPALGCSYANAGLVNGLTASPWSAPGIPATVLREFWRDDAPYRVRLRADLAMAVWIARFFGNCTAARTKEIKKTLRCLSSYNLALLRDIRQREAVTYDCGTSGLIYLYRDTARLNAAASTAESDPDLRSRPRRLTPDEAAAMEPALARARIAFAGALLYDQDETGDARLFTQALASMAGSAASFRFGVEVDSLVVTGDRISGINTTSGERIDVDAVVLAAGTGSARLAAPFGIRLPVYPVKGYSVTVRSRNPDILPRHALQDAQRKVTLTPLGERLRAAGTAELDGHNNRLDRRRADTLLKAMETLLPDLRWTGEPEFWAGLRPMTPDCMPVIGRTHVDGLWLNTGHGSHGWTLACGSGRVVADLIRGRRPEISLDGLGLR
jgi:D-amino-acid dehydrogenase